MEQQPIKIAVLGGSGKTGQYLVKHLLNFGHSLKVLVRNPETFTIENPLLEVVQGNALDYNDIDKLISGCQAVMSTIGNRKGEPPVSAPATENIIKAMTKYNIKRYIAITGLTINTPKDVKSRRIRFRSALMRLLYPKVIEDKQHAYDLLSESNLDWTLVRVPFIEFTGTRKYVQVGLHDCPGKMISSTDVSFFMADQLADTKYIKEAPFISNR